MRCVNQKQLPGAALQQSSRSLSACVTAVWQPGLLLTTEEGRAREGGWAEGKGKKRVGGERRGIGSSGLMGRQVYAHAHACVRARVSAHMCTRMHACACVWAH